MLYYFLKGKITLNKTNYKGIGYGRAYTSILPLPYCFTNFFIPINLHVYFVPLAIILLRTGTVVIFACPAHSPVVYILWISLNVKYFQEERRAGREEGRGREKGGERYRGKYKGEMREEKGGKKGRRKERGEEGREGRRERRGEEKKRKNWEGKWKDKREKKGWGRRAENCVIGTTSVQTSTSWRCN